MQISESIVAAGEQAGLLVHEDAPTYIWAFDAIAFNLLTWATLLILGLAYRCILGCILFLCLYVPLRIFAGGFHAKTQSCCYLISVITFFSLVLCSNYNDMLFRAFQVPILCVSVLVIYVFAPVSTNNKPLCCGEIIHHRRIARRILIVEIILVLLVTLICDIETTSRSFFFFTIHLHIIAIQMVLELIFRFKTYFTGKK